MLTPLLLTILAASPALPVNLRLEPTADSPTRVVFRLTNGADVPVRVVGHRGLLSLDVRVPGKRAPIKCSPPGGSRPAVVDPERITLLAPGASVAEVVDVRWYCWSSRATKALATPGALVEAHYGYRRASARTWIASSLDGITRVAKLDAEPLPAPVDRGDGLDRGGTGAVTPAPAGPPAPALSLRPVPARIDAGTGRSLAVALRLDNTSPDDVRVFVRPELFRFGVRGPTDDVRCALPRAERSPMRESFKRLAPRRRTSLVLDLAALCPRGTFATPGVYDIEPSFEATDDGDRVGLRAVTGAFIGAPLVVRVGRGDLRHYEPQEPPL